MQLFSIKPGLVIDRDAHRYQFIRYNLKQQLIFQDDVGQTWCPTTAEVLAEYLQRTVTVPSDQPYLGIAPTMRLAPLDLSFFSTKEQNEARRRESYLKHLLYGRETLPNNQTIVDELPRIHRDIQDSRKIPSVSAIRRWWRAYRKTTSAVSLVPLHSKKGQSRAIIGELADLVDDMIQEHYLQPERPNMRFAHQRIQSKIIEINAHRPPSLRITCPSYSTLVRYISLLDPYQVAVAREGKHAARQKFREATGTVRAADILSRWEIDHTLLDVVVIDEETGMVIGRPYLTVALDRHSRMVMGYWLHMQAPCTESVLRVIELAIKPKQLLLKGHPNIKSDWPAFGMPRTIVPDNAAEFHAHNLVDAFMELGIEILYPPSRSPQHKGAVERFFRTLSDDIVHVLPGTTFSNVPARGDYESEKRACFTMDSLNALVLRWIVDIYHNKPHRGLRGKTPSQVWAEQISHRVVHLPVDLDQLEAVLAYRTTRSVHHYGVEIGGVRYNSNELQMIRHRPNAGETLRIHFRDDMSHVWVADDVLKHYLQVPATDQRVVGMSRDIYDAARREAKKLGNRDLSVGRVLLAYDDIVQDIEKAKRDVKLIKRREAARKKKDLAGNSLSSPVIPAAETQPDLFEIVDDFPIFSVTNRDSGMGVPLA